jgi:hypothetical protein
VQNFKSASQKSIKILIPGTIFAPDGAFLEKSLKKQAFSSCFLEKNVVSLYLEKKFLQDRKIL